MWISKSDSGKLAHCSLLHGIIVWSTTHSLTANDLRLWPTTKHLPARNWVALVSVHSSSGTPTTAMCLAWLLKRTVMSRQHRIYDYIFLQYNTNTRQKLVTRTMSDSWQNRRRDVAGRKSDVQWCSILWRLLCNNHTILYHIEADSVRDLVLNLININKTIIIITHCSGATGAQCTGRHDSLLSIRLCRRRSPKQLFDSANFNFAALF